MKTNNSKTKTKAFLGAAFMLLIALIFTACPQKVKPKAEEAPAAPPEYTPVAYDKLAEYLANTASATKINKIEVTGLKAEHLKGDASNWPYTLSPLGAILNAAPTKQVALKLGGGITGLTDMQACFFQCKSLVQITAIPKGVQNMKACFFGCEKLTKAPEIPKGVTNMHQCFSSCRELTKAPAIPEGVQNMERCFQECEKLTKAPVIPANVTDMGGCFSGCTSLKEAPEIPANLTGIANCFQNCTSLTKAPSSLPANVTNMHECFRDCTSLTKAPAIPDGVTNMTRCFQYCGNLEEAPEIPQPVTYISSCFEGCGKIKGVVLKCNYRDGSFSDLFKGCNALKTGSIKVPQGQLQNYKNNAGKMKTNPNNFSE